MALWGKTDASLSAPKWINLANYPAGTRLVFVDVTEAQSPDNKERGMTSPGWWLYRTYTDVNGSVHNKVEQVVALSSSVTAIAAGDQNTDDGIVVDFGITVQPVDSSVAVGANATFGITATGAGVTYQWQVKIGAAAYTNIANGADYSGVTTNTLTVISAQLADNANRYRCVATQTNGGTINSKAGILTVA